MHSETIGYAVIEWNQASGQPDLIAMYHDAAYAKEEAIRQQRDTERRGRADSYTVARVVQDDEVPR